jgi:hypothetical protein
MRTLTSLLVTRLVYPLEGDQGSNLDDDIQHHNETTMERYARTFKLDPERR